MDTSDVTPILYETEIIDPSSSDPYTLQEIAPYTTYIFLLIVLSIFMLYFVGKLLTWFINNFKI